VLKIVSADIAHKSEIGGVKLNLGSNDAVAQAYAAIRASAALHAPTARIDGVMVAPMTTGGIEMIAGVQRDPVFGPVVMLGLGGVFVEVLKDVAFRHAPFGPADARAMVAELRGAAILGGVRGLGPADIDALVAAIVALGRFAADNAETLHSVEINPLLVRSAGNGVVGLDALVTAA
jgi:succinyl-CoA synthetase beta subunit